MIKKASLPITPSIKKTPSLERGRRLFFAFVDYIITLAYGFEIAPYRRKRIKEDIKDELVALFNKERDLELTYRFKLKGFNLQIISKIRLSLMTFEQLKAFLEYTFSKVTSEIDLKPFEISRLYYLNLISKREFIEETEDSIELLPEWGQKIHQKKLKGGF
jgi:hypothetical protein